MIALKAIHLGFTLIAVVLVSPGESVDCQSQNSLLQALEKCMANEGLPTGLIHDLSSLEHSILAEHGDLLCSFRKESYMNAFECIGGIMRNCVPENISYIVPEPEKWRQMTSYLCDNRHDVDFQCILRHNQRMKECSMPKAKDYVKNGGTYVGEQFRCYVFETQFECGKEILSICGCPTAKVYSDIVLDIMMPTSCQKNTKEQSRLICYNIAQEVESAKSTYPTTFSPLPTPAPLLPLSTMTPVASCTSVYSVKRRAIKCFTDQNINDENLFNHYTRSTFPYALAEALLAKHGASFCSSYKVRFAAAVACTLRLTQKCLPYQYRKLLPSPSTAQPMVDKLCQHQEDIDFNCVVDKTEDLFECGRQKGYSYATSGGDTSMGPLRCITIKATFTCNQGELKSCGCKTAKLYSDLVIDVLYPDSSCRGQDLDHHRMTCEVSDNHSPIRTSDQDKLPNAYQAQKSLQTCLNSKQNEIWNCYSRRHIYNTKNQYSFSTGDIFSESIIHSIMLDNIDTICTPSKIGKIRDAIRCEETIVTQCAGTEGHRLSDDFSRNIQIFNRLCENEKDIDLRCALDKMANLDSCPKYPTLSLDLTMPKEQQHACQSFLNYAQCIKAHPSSCGCATAKVYADIIYDYHVPVTCNKNYINTITCGGNNARNLACTFWLVLLFSWFGGVISRYM